MLRKGYVLLLATTLALVPMVEALAQAGAAGGAAGGGGAGAGGAGAGGGVPEGQRTTGGAENSKTNRDAVNVGRNGEVSPPPMAKNGSSTMDKK
jgi:hypothetical protein